jgi:methionine aminotransferase
MPPVQITSKLPDLPVTIFTAMTLLAREHGAINLGQGFPDFMMDPRLIRHVQEAMEQGHNQYAHTFGYPGLREILSQKAKNLYGFGPDPETEITITPGGTYAISNALTSVLQPGDEVIVFEPCFDSYLPNIRIMGALPVCIPLNFPDYSIPWEEVRARITPKTRMILLNSPHNPTGTLLSENDISELRNVVEGTNILIMSDEVYEHLIFEKETHQSLLRYPDLFARAFVAFSLGKVFHCTGWKIGYCMAPAYLTREFRNHHQFNVFSVHSPTQVAMARHLEDPEVYLGLGSFFEAKRNLLLEVFSNSMLTPLSSKGSYFQCFTFPEGLGMTSYEMAVFMTQKIGLTSIPVSSFYEKGTDHRVLRFCFAKENTTLEEAGNRLKNLEETLTTRS